MTASELKSFPKNGTSLTCINLIIMNIIRHPNSNLNDYFFNHIKLQLSWLDIYGCFLHFLRLIGALFHGFTIEIKLIMEKIRFTCLEIIEMHDNKC